MPFADVSGSLGLPVRDWSRQTSVNRSKDEDRQGSKKVKGGMRKKKDDAGRRMSEQAFIRGLFFLLIVSKHVAANQTEDLD